MKITISQRRGLAKITAFDGIKKINTLDELLDVARFDHVSAVLGEHTDAKTGKYEKYHRSDDCFISADTLFMDCDNESENPEKWLTPQAFADRLTGIRFFWVFSRNNMQVKEGKSARPRWHVYFPLSREYTDKSEYKGLKKKILSAIPEFDNSCSDATRLHYGVENPTGGFHDGDKCLDEIIDSLIGQGNHETTANSKEEVIEYGFRNSTMYKAAISYLMNNTAENARKKFDKKSMACEPRLEHDELETIWNSAINSNSVQLLNMAMKVLEGFSDSDENGNGGIFYDSLKEIYLDRAKEISNDKKIIESAWQTAIKRDKRKRKPAEKEKFKLTHLTLRDIQNALQEDGITIKTNVITKEIEVDGIPLDSPYTPYGFEKLSAGKRAALAGDMIQAYLIPKLKEHYKFSESYFNSALLTLSKMTEHNPVIDFISSTPWDGFDRFEKLAEVLGVTETPLYCSYLKKFFIQAIAMALNNEEKHEGNEFVLVLQGAQGIGKTEFFRKIALKPEWFLEGWSYDAANKDTAIAASKVFICELGELDHTLKKQQAALKSYITSVYDTYRIPYDKNAQTTLRHTVFGATVNDEKFLIDTEGGSRRWAVVKLTKDFHEELFKLPETFFAQLYAQAYQLYMQGENFRLSHEERIAMETENQLVTVPKKGELEINECLDWEANITKWKEKSPSDIINGADLHGVTAMDVGKALNKIMVQDARVQKRRLSRGYVYLLPPFRSVNGSNIYESVKDIDFQDATTAQISEKFTDATNTVTKEKIEQLYDELREYYTKNKCKTRFDDFVRSFGSNTLADWLKQPLSYEESEKIKEAVVKHYHITAA